MTATRKLKAPAHLSASAKAWWQSVMEDFTLEPHHELLLLLACEAFDRCAQGREILAKEGITIKTGDGGAKAHPAVAIERDSRLAFARLLREIGLDAEAPGATRPPSLPGYR